MTRAKRAMDIFWSGLGIAALLPVLPLVALLIKCEDGGPVFFRQERIGLHGRPFRMWKLRTMRRHADRMGPLLTVGADPRVTRVGRWLRRHKIDELPQLWNVLMGDMSLVGPRPEVRRYVALYTPEQRRVLQLLPGITDIASIKYREEGALLATARDWEHTYVTMVMPDKIRLNLAYAARATVWRDHRVLLATVRPGSGGRTLAVEVDGGQARAP